MFLMGTDLARRGRMSSHLPTLFLRGAVLSGLVFGLAACAKVRGDMFATATPSAPLSNLELRSCVAGTTRGLDRGVILTGKGQVYDIGVFPGGRVPGTLQPGPIREVVLHDRATGADVSFSENDCRVLEGEVISGTRSPIRPPGDGVEALGGVLRIQCERDGTAIWGTVRFERCSI
jgi:hypothetical protein